METIMDYCKGNLGAMTFLMELMSPNCGKGIQILGCLDRLKSIRGTNLYILWSDLCDKDIEKVYKLCANCPGDILEDACSRQDYSGRILVKKYLETTCPDCRGTGEVDVIDTKKVHGQSIDIPYKKEKCESCKGEKTNE